MGINLRKVKLLIIQELLMSVTVMISPLAVAKYMQVLEDRVRLFLNGKTRSGH